MNSFVTMRELIEEKYRSVNKDKKGDLGEALAICHFEKTNQHFIHVHQETWSFPNTLKERNAQRPDFYMLPITSKINVVDVKHWELNNNMDFILPQEKLFKYLELQLYLMEVHGKPEENFDDIEIKFFVIPSQLCGDAYAEVTLSEMVSNEVTDEITLPNGVKIKKTHYKLPLKDRLKVIGTLAEPFIIEDKQ